MLGDQFVINLGVEFEYDKTELEHLTKEVQKDFKTVSSKFNIIDKNNVDQAYDYYFKLWEKLEVAYEKFQKAQVGGNQKIAKQAQGEFKQILDLMNKLSEAGKNADTDKYFKLLEASVRQSLKSIQESYSGYSDQINVAATSSANFDRAVKQTTTGLERQQISADKITEKMSSLNQQLDKLETSYKNGSITTEQYRTRLQQLSDKYERLHEQENNVYTNTDRLKNKFKETQGSLDGVSQAVDTCDTKMKDMSATSGQVRQRVDRLSEALDNRSGLTKWLSDFKEGFQQGIGQITGMSAGLKAFQLVCQATQQAISAVVSEVKELNSAMTDVQMVAGTTSSETMQMFKDYNQLAKDLSVTTTDVIAGASDWLRQGKSQQETMDLIKASTIQATLANMDYSTSTELLTSTLNGYQLEADKAMHVVDALVQVDFEAATSVDELATSLQKTANTARVSGVDFERLVGYLGAVSEATRQAPELIGRSFKTMFSRMQSISAGQDIDEEGNAINDVEEVLNKLGIRLRDTNNTFRSMSDVLDDVNARWDTFSDTQKQQISNAIAGKNQMEIFLALMENYDKALYLEEAALNADGAAMERYGIYQESITAKQNELKAAFEEFANSQSVIDLIKSFYELGEAGISLLNVFKPLIDIFSSTLTIISKLTGGVLDFVSAVFTLDTDYFEKIFGHDTQADIENTETKISSLEEQIKKIEDSDIDINVKQEELDTLREALKEANDELERLRRDQRNSGYNQKVNFDYYNTVSDRNFQIEENVNVSNAISLYQQLETQISNVTAKQNSFGKSYKELSKEQQIQYKQNEKTLESLRKNQKTVEDAIVSIYAEIAATQEIYDANGRYADSLTENERIIVEYVNEHTYLLDAYHELIGVSEDASNAIDQTADSMDDASDSADDMASALKSVASTVEILDKEYKAINAALKEFEEQGKISTSTALTLVDANEKFADALVIVGNEITIDIEKLKDLQTQALVAANAVYTATKTMTLSQLEAEYELALDNNNVQYAAGLKQQIEAVKNSLISVGTGTGNYIPYIPPVSTDKGSSSSSSGSHSSSSSSDRDAERELREQQKAYLDGLKERQNAFKAYLDAILRIFEKEKDALEKQKDEWEDYYDAKIDALKEQEELEEQEKERQELLLDIEEKRAALAKANQQVVRVYLRNQGFVYRQDTEAIAAAQDELNKSLQAYSEWEKKLDRDNAIKELEDAKDKVIADLDDQIDKLDELADKWKESLDITEDVTTYKDLLDDMAKFEKANLDERLKYLDDFTNAYMNLINMINEANKIYNSGTSGIGSSGGAGSGSISEIGSGSSGGSSSGGSSGNGDIWYNAMGNPVKTTGGSSDRLIFDGEIGYIYKADGSDGIFERLGIEKPKGDINLSGGIQSWFLNNWGWNPLEGSVPHNVLINGVPLGQNQGIITKDDQNKKPIATTGSSTSSSSSKNPDTGRGDYWDNDNKTYTNDKDSATKVPESLRPSKDETGKPTSSARPTGADRADQITANRDKVNSSSSSSGSAGSKGNSISQADWDDMNFASGTRSVPRDGLALVGEEGPEIRFLNQGDGIVPADATENLMNWGMYSPSEFLSRIGDMTFTERSVGGDVYNMNFDSIVLPNVDDFESFKDELMANSKNYAVQIQSERI